MINRITKEITSILNLLLRCLFQSIIELRKLISRFLLYVLIGIIISFIYNYCDPFKIFPHDFPTKMDSNFQGLYSIIIGMEVIAFIFICIISLLKSKNYKWAKNLSSFLLKEIKIAIDGNFAFILIFGTSAILLRNDSNKNYQLVAVVIIFLANNYILALINHLQIPEGEN